MTGQSVYLDSSAIIKRYLKEEGTDIIDGLFKQTETKESILCFSVWNIGEVIGVLDKNNRRNKNKLLGSISDFVNELGRLNRTGSIDVVNITISMIFNASLLLIKYKIYIADALQIVSCAEAKCNKFFTADKRVHDVAVKEGLNSTLIISS